MIRIRFRFSLSFSAGKYSFNTYALLSFGAFAGFFRETCIDFAVGHAASIQNRLGNEKPDYGNPISIRPKNVGRPPPGTGPLSPVPSSNESGRRKDPSKKGLMIEEEEEAEKRSL